MWSIVDINAFDNDCPTDYEILITWVWPGSYHGCYDQVDKKFNKDKTCTGSEVEVPKTGAEDIKKLY